MRANVAMLIVDIGGGYLKIKFLFQLVRVGVDGFGWACSAAPTSVLLNHLMHVICANS